MQGSRSEELLGAVLEYIRKEAEATARPIKKDEWHLLNGAGPYQDNEFDSGVFMCESAQLISRDKTLEFGQRHIPLCQGLMKLEIQQGCLYTRF